MEWKSRDASTSPEKENRNSNWLKSKKAWNNALSKIRIHSALTPKDAKPFNQTHRLPLSEPPSPPPPPPHQPPKPSTNKPPEITDLVLDKTSLLSDEILLNILAKLPDSQRNSSCLVSKRWLNLQGRLVRSVKLFDWDFLVTGRLFFRFPNLIHVDLVNACLGNPRNSGVFCSHKTLSFHVASGVEMKNQNFFYQNSVLNADEINEGLQILANSCPNLQKLAVINSTEMGLLTVAEECPSLQELDLLMCNDNVLRGIAAYQNLQVLRLTGTVDGFYESLISDIGLTILAQGCKNLMKLELNGCCGGYEGVKAIGQCCQMLQELMLSDHRMEDGWLLGLPYCENLRVLRLVSCRKVDGIDGEFGEDWGFCSAVGSLHLEKCQLRDRRELRALFRICSDAKEVALRNCWGMNDDVFSASITLRKVRSLSLEGCSLVTTHGLESVIVCCKEVESLKVNSCNSIKECEMNAEVFSALKDLHWKPDTRSELSANLDGTGLRKRGSKFLKKTDWKSLPGA